MHEPAKAHCQARDSSPSSHGRLELAITPSTDLYLLDMSIGQIEDAVCYKPDANESGRPYGGLGAYDLTGEASAWQNLYIERD